MRAESFIDRHASSGLWEYWERFKEVLPGGESLGDGTEVLDRISASSVLADIISAVKSGYSEALSCFFSLFGVCVLVAVFLNFSPSERALPIVECAVLTLASVAVFTVIRPVVYIARDSLLSVSKLFTSIIPISCGLLAASGNLTVAGVQAAGMSLTGSLVVRLSTELLLPMVFTIFSFALICGFASKESRAIVGYIRSTFLVIFGLISTVLLSTFALQSSIATASDTLTLRTAKQLLGATVPVVGSTISASLSSVLGAFSFIRSSMGAGAVVVLLSLMLPPLVSLLLVRLSLSLCTTFLDFVGTGGGVRVFSAFTSGIDTLLSVYVISCVAYVFELFVFMRCGVDAFG